MKIGKKQQPKVQGSASATAILLGKDEQKVQNAARFDRRVKKPKRRGS